MENSRVNELISQSLEQIKLSTISGGDPVSFFRKYLPRLILPVKVESKDIFPIEGNSPHPQGIHPQGITPGIYPGKFYLMRYSSKQNKSKDPFDIFPLLFVSSIDSQYILGFNWHYIPIKLRFQLLEMILKYFPEQFVNNDFIPIIDFNTLNRVIPRFSEIIKPAIRKYLIKDINVKLITEIENKDMIDSIRYTSSILNTVRP